MRKKFLYFVITPVVALFLVLYIFLDRWVASGLEYAGEKANGAKVEFEHLKLTLSPLGIRWDRLQVADKHDPWTNIFETGKVQLAINLGQLLRGKYIVEAIDVTEVILGTHRTTDGSLPVEKQTPPASGDSTFAGMAEQSFAGSAPKPAATEQQSGKPKINVDSLVKAADLQSLNAIDSLNTQTLSASKQWDASLSDLKKVKSRLSDVGNDLKTINPSQLKGADQVLKAITTVDNDVKTVGDISKDVGGRASSIQADVTRLSLSVSELDQVAARDFQHLMGLANISSLNASGIARMIVGKPMVDRAVSYLHYIDVARSMIKKYTPAPKDPEPQRMRGQDIAFPVERHYPKFWIRRVHLSGGTDSLSHDDFIRARGEIRDITNDQTATGTPTVINLEGMQAGKRAMTLSAIFDRTKAEPYDEFSATLSGVPLKEFAVGNEGLLPGKITNAHASTATTAKVPGNQFDVHAKVTISDFQLHYSAEPKNTIETIVRSILDNVHQFGVTIGVWRRNGIVDCSFATDLDSQIEARLKDVVGQEVASLQSDLRKKIDARIAPKKKELEDLLSSKRDAANKAIAEMQGLVAQQSGSLDAKKKELTSKLEGENKGKIENALKGILKK